MITNNHAWGESWDIYRDKSVWVVGFRGRKGGASSMHVHKYMTNDFYVVSGVLELVTLYDWNSDNSSPDICFVQPGESYPVWSDIGHKLVFNEDTEGIETYYALPGHEIDPADIVRLSPAKAPE